MANFTIPSFWLAFAVGRLLHAFNSLAAGGSPSSAQIGSATAYGANVTTSNPILLHGGTFITYNSTSESLYILRDGYLLIQNGVISKISAAPITDYPSNTELMDTTGRIISPGFVNTHNHGWQTVFRTQAPDTTLWSYLYEWGFFGRAAFSFKPEDLHISQLMGLYESINAGVTSIVDHAHATWSKEHAEAALQASIESGIRMWFCYTVGAQPINADPYTLDPTSEDWQKKHIDEISKRGLLGDGRVILGLGYNGFASGMEREVAVGILSFAASHNLTPITTHYVGGNFQKTLRTVQLLDEFDLLSISTPIIFSHSSTITWAESELLRKTDQYISTTPESEHHYGHDNANRRIMDHTSLGVDTHFTFSADIITQMRLHLQKTRLDMYKEVEADWKIPNNTGMTTDQAFLLGTRNGGLALHRPDIGVLQEGAKADIVIFDGTSLGLLGWKDPVAAIVLHSHVGNIDSVIIDGIFRKRNGKLIGVEWEKLKETFLKSVEDVYERMQKIVLAPLRSGVWEVFGYKESDFQPLEMVRVTPGEA
ncbi:hypothetical protein RUND412_005896 [Rhizina undulata]